VDSDGHNESCVRWGFRSPMGMDNFGKGAPIGELSSSNAMWPGPRPTSLPSFILIYPTVWPLPCEMSSVLKARNENKTTSVTTYFKKLKTTRNNVFIVLSQLLSKVAVTSCSFYIKCSMYPPCCWTTHSSWRRHH